MNGGRASRKDSFSLRLPRRCKAEDFLPMGFNLRVSKHGPNLLSRSRIVVLESPPGQARPDSGLLKSLPGNP